MIFNVIFDANCGNLEVYTVYTSVFQPLLFRDHAGVPQKIVKFHIGIWQEVLNQGHALSMSRLC